MGSRPRFVAERFSKLPSVLNTWEISHTTRRGAVGPYRVRPGTRGRTPPLSCPRPDRTKSVTKSRQKYRFFRLLTLSNVFRINDRWGDG
jgi:hypothetical protein